MMKTHTSLFNRFEDLVDQINFHFEDINPDDIDEMAFDFDRVVMDMFEVRRVGINWVSLMHLYTDEVYEPIFAPEEIRVLLEERDTFLMALGETSAGWYVLYMSPPLDTADLNWNDGRDDLTETDSL